MRQRRLRHACDLVPQASQSTPAPTAPSQLGLCRYWCERPFPRRARPHTRPRTRPTRVAAVPELANKSRGVDAPNFFACQNQKFKFSMAAACPMMALLPVVAFGSAAPQSLAVPPPSLWLLGQHYGSFGPKNQPNPDPDTIATNYAKVFGDAAAAAPLADHHRGAIATQAQALDHVNGSVDLSLLGANDRSDTQQESDSSQSTDMSQSSDASQNQDLTQLTNSSEIAHSGWGPWSPCSVTCGYGVSTRQCTARPPSCVGYLAQTCNAGACDAVHGGWGTWSHCSTSCGNGVQIRICDSPRPAHGGDPCAGGSVRTCRSSAPSCQPPKANSNAQGDADPDETKKSSTPLKEFDESGPSTSTAKDAPVAEARSSGEQKSGDGDSATSRKPAIVYYDDVHSPTRLGGGRIIPVVIDKPIPVESTPFRPVPVGPGAPVGIPVPFRPAVGFGVEHTPSWPGWASTQRIPIAPSSYILNDETTQDFGIHSLRFATKRNAPEDAPENVREDAEDVGASREKTKTHKTHEFQSQGRAFESSEMLTATSSRDIISQASLDGPPVVEHAEGAKLFQPKGKPRFVRLKDSYVAARYVDEGDKDSFTITSASNAVLDTV